MKKSQQEIYRDLSLLGRWDRVKEFGDVLNNLEEPVDIITYEEGYFFRLALKKAEPELLKTLLKYYEDTKLQKDSNSLDYKVARHKLLETLQAAADNVEVTKEAQKVLNQYNISSRNDDSDADGGSEGKSKATMEMLEGVRVIPSESEESEEMSYESGASEGSHNLTSENLQLLMGILAGAEGMSEVVLSVSGEG